MNQSTHTYNVTSSIVLYKNEPKEVSAAIRSFLSTPLEVMLIVVDNSPDDNLRLLVESEGAQYIFNGKNVGYGAGHNIAIDKCTGCQEYHLILNPDIAFEPETIPLLYRFMNDNQNIGLVMPRILYADGSEQRLCKLLPTPADLLIRRFLGRHSRFIDRLKKYELWDVDLDIPREVPSLSGCFMFIRSSTLLRIGRFDERYFMYMEDVDLCRRIGKYYKTVFYPLASITHGYAKGSYRNSTLLKYHVQSAAKYFVKWGWLYDPEKTRLNKNTSALDLGTGSPFSES